jgi:NAD(P)-dependent dehydrogenase (short-subunit alcohol dehydrogenase family)
MTIDLSNKTVLITGASKGIGASAAETLHRLGANVVLMARGREALEALAGSLGGKRALVVAGDVCDYAAVKDAVDQAVAYFGGLDAVVNNAGVIDPIARLEESDPTAWAKVVEINLMGVYNGMHAAFEPLRASGGTIINISSGAATNALEGWSHYCATKAAVLSLTRSGHKEWGPLGITVVGLSPGTVATNMQVLIKESGVNPISTLEWGDHIPPEWAAQAIAYLCTDGAKPHAGTDFSLKTEEGRREAGLLD